MKYFLKKAGLIFIVFMSITTLISPGKNGSIQTPFNKRISNCLSPNDEDFVNSRDFCILPFNVLIDYSAKCASDPQIKKVFWEKIHGTSGLLLNILR